MLLGTLGASLLENLLTGKVAMAISHRQVVNKKGKGIHRAGERVIRAGEGNDNNMDLWIYENESRFNGVYSKDNLPNKIKDGPYVINLDEYSDIGIHWIGLYVKNNDITYFDSFGVEHIPKEIIKFIDRKNIIANIFRIQAYDSIMCGYFCIGFINFMFKGKTLTDYTNLFSPNDFKRNDDIILNYFMNNTYV